MGRDKDKEPLIVEEQRTGRKRRQRIKRFNDFNLLNYLKQYLPTAKLDYIASILYLVFTGYLALFFISIPAYWNEYVQVFIMLPALFATLLIIAYAILQEEQYDKLAGLVFGLGMIYFLMFTNLLLCLITDFYHIPSVLLMVGSMLLLLFSPHWLPFVGISLVTTYLATYTFVYYKPLADLPETISKNTNPTYYYFPFAFVAILIMVRYFKKHQQEKEMHTLVAKKESYNKDKNLDQLRFQHQLNRCVNSLTDEEDLLPRITKELSQITTNIPLAEKKAIHENIIPRLLSYRDFVQERVYYDRCHIPLVITQTSITTILEEGIKYFETIYGRELSIIMVDKGEVPTILRCDQKKLEQMFIATFQFIRECIGEKPATTIYIHLDATTITYDMNGDEKQFKKIPSIAITITTHKKRPVIEETYEELLDVIAPIVPDSNLTLYRKEMVEVSDAHYGCIDIDETERYVTVSYILPLKLEEIRDSVMDELPKSFYFLDAASNESHNQENDLVRLLTEGTSLEEQFVLDTIRFVKRCHGNQKRKSGEPFYTHPMSVIEILLEVTKEPSTLVAALLHDVVEDSLVPISYIKARFGHDVAYIVSKVTHLGSTVRKKKMSPVEMNRLLKAELDNDIRPIQVKIADRLHNVRTLSLRTREKRTKVAMETLVFYVPLAEKLGMEEWATELRKVCNKYIVH